MRSIPKPMNKLITCEKLDLGIFTVEYQFKTCVIPFLALYKLVANDNVILIAIAKKSSLIDVMRSLNSIIQLVDSSNIRLL